jgi:hypothetical protein
MKLKSQLLYYGDLPLLPSISILLVLLLLVLLVVPVHTSVYIVMTAVHPDSNARVLLLSLFRQVAPLNITSYVEKS